MATATDLAWASGLFEGEGCITKCATVYNDGKAMKKYPRLVLTMTDEDSVRRFAEVIGFGNVYWYRKERSHYKDQWRWQVTGFEKTQAALAMLWNGLGSRRKARAREILGR